MEIESRTHSLRTSVLVVCAVSALAAGWLTLGGMQRLNHADSMIPAFVSLYRWTWFYWGQNRFGMLTALLAMPVHNPLMNLLFQNGLTTFCGLMVFPVAHAFLAGWRTAPLAGLVGAGVWLLCGSEGFHQDYLLDNQPYAVSTCLGLLGLMAMISRAGILHPCRGRRLLAFGLLFLSFWVSLAAAFLVLPLIVLWAMTVVPDNQSVRRAMGFGALPIISAALANWAIARFYRYGENLGWAGPLSWPRHWVRLCRSAWHETPGAFLVALVVLVAIGIAGMVMSRGPRLRRRVIPGWLAFLMVAWVYSILAAATDHARQSNFVFRYAIPAIVLAVISATAFATTVVENLSNRSLRLAEGVLALGLLIGITMRYGSPSYTRVREIMKEGFGDRTKEILDNQCTHICGDYWDAWQSAFDVNQTLYESGSSKVVWAITFRSEVTRDLWLPLLTAGQIAGLRTEGSDSEWQNQAKENNLPALKAVSESSRIKFLKVDSDGS